MTSTAVKASRFAESPASYDGAKHRVGFRPYSTYYDSEVEWLGDIPAGWHIKPMFSVARESRLSNAGLVEDNLLSLSYGRIKRKDIESLGGLLPESFETYQVVNESDVIFRLTDLQNDKRSLRTAICTEKGIITSAYVAVTPAKIDPHYFAYLMRAYDELKVFYNLGSGMRQSLKYDELKRLPIVLPPNDLQQRIVAFLDRETARIDNLSAEKQSFIHLLKEKRQVLISHVVTKGLDARVKMKDSGIKWIGEVPAHWRNERLDRLFRQVKRQEHEDLEVLSVYRDYGVIAKSSRDDNINKTPEDLGLYQLVESGDLVINKMKAWQGSLGVSRLVGITSPDYVVYKSLHDECDEFIHHTLRSQHMHNHYSTISTGIRPGQWRLETDKFKCIRIFLPPKDEQMGIARFLEAELDRISRLVDEVEASIELLREHRTALISAAVTGKIDVRDQI